ncbi:hypothetical protein GDO86_009956 [Hymenochirus boettgeri]|uniref:Dynein regulatory complex protein 9 n=1 Tax=Hymenochirus boettgeri TaxID=247094 RepID=A0A8T2JNL2_9PIPI|nr:hypothetical protein GDO86_009956 [Hymenochirus boettgeri]
MTQLSMLDMLRVSTVLEDSLDQLSILGYIMPVAYHGRSDIVGNEIGDILKFQRSLEGRFEDLMGKRIEIQTGSPSVSKKLFELNKEVEETSGNLKISNKQFIRAVKQSPLTSDNLKKIQAERQFAADVIGKMIIELEASGSFNSLKQAVAMQKEKKNNFYDAISREEEGRRKIKLIQKQLQEVKNEKEEEMQGRSELIAYLKDQLQNMKAKTSMEGKYVKKDTDLQIFQTQTKCNTAETNLQFELKRIKEKMDEETRVHMEIENFLRQHQQELEEKLEYWMEKYDKDTEEKQAELNSLKASRAQDLTLLQESATKCKEFEKIIIEDRLEKERTQRQKIQEKNELASAIKLQAWWRGMMVRKGLGVHKKTKGKNDKNKGKKSKAKKGGKKK